MRKVELRVIECRIRQDVLGSIIFITVGRSGSKPRAQVELKPCNWLDSKTLKFDSPCGAFRVFLLVVKNLIGERPVCPKVWDFPRGR